MHQAQAGGGVREDGGGEGDLPLQCQWNPHPLHHLEEGRGAAPAQEETQGLPGHPDHYWTAEAGPRRVRVCGQYRLLRSRQFNDGLMTSCSGETGGTNNICRLLLVTIIGS